MDQFRKSFLTDFLKLYFFSTCKRICIIWSCLGCLMHGKTTWGVGRTALEMRLPQQVVIPSTDLFLWDSKWKGPVCSVSSCRETIPHIFICCHYWERCTCISTNNVVFITLGSSEWAPPIRSQLLFSIFIFANEVVFGLMLAAVVIPSEFVLYRSHMRRVRGLLGWQHSRCLQ